MALSLYRCAFALSLAGAVSMASAATPSDRSLDALWSIVEQQQAQIDSLRSELDRTRDALGQAEGRAEAADARLAQTEERLVATAEYVEALETDSGVGGNATQIGGYGELHYSRLDADDSANDRDEADFHRFVVFLNHQFNDRVQFVSELELEHSLVKDTADGSNGGEVELEQAYIDFALDDRHYARGGLFLIPVGILNETHEPPTFFGVERNDVENIIIPTTWWEAGVGFGGRYGSGFSWDAAVHTGLDVPTDGGSAARLRSGRQKVSNANAEDLAYTLRLRYTGVPGLELAGTYHHQTDLSQMSGDGLGAADLLSAHLAWQRGGFGLRALWAEWDIDGPLARALDADTQRGWYVEPSYRTRLGQADIGFYGRFEDLRGARTRDRFDQWEVGMNYWPTENVVVKIDYRDRSHDLSGERGRDFNAVDLGIGYQF